jgi:MoaA/NifB/PqqE/SkfB family radical SAM enzyme
MCDSWKNKHTDELSTEEFKKILEQLKAVGIQFVEFTGGEPLLRKDIDILVRKANELGFKNIGITTNGLLLKNKAKQLLKNGITHISVSIDGMEDTNDAIRGVPHSYEKSIEGIKTVNNLKHRYNLPVTINVNTTLMKYNIHEIQKLIEICYNLDVEWNFNLLNNNLYFFTSIDISDLKIDDEKSVDMAIDYLIKIKKSSNIVSVSHDQIEYARNYLKGIDSKPSCVVEYSTVYIGSRGDMYSGCWALKPLGNLLEKNIRDIIKSGKYKKRARDMFLRRCPGCTCSYGSNVTFSSNPICFLSRAINAFKHLR